MGVFAVVLAAPGCIDQARLVALRDDAQTVRDQVAGEQARLEDAALDPNLAPETRTASAEASAALAERVGDLDAAIAALDRLIESEQNPEEAWNDLAGAVVPILPEPMRTPALLVGALAAALFRAAQLKRAAGSIAKSVAKAAEKDDEFRSALTRHADTFRVVQTPAARRIVDEKVRSGFMLRLPV